MSVGIEKKTVRASSRVRNISLDVTAYLATGPSAYVLGSTELSDPVAVAPLAMGAKTYAASTSRLISFDAKAVMSSIDDMKLKIEDLAMQVQEMKLALMAANDYCTFIATLGVEKFELKKPIPVTISTRDGGVVAGFLDANISAGGDSVPEAIADLQNLLVDVFDDISGRPDSTLGPEVQRQKRILLETVCRTS